MSSTFDRFTKILREHITPCPEVEITPATDIARDLKTDSLDFVEVVMACEVEFGIEVPDDDAEAVKTVAEAVALIDRLIPAGPTTPGGE